MIADTKWIEGKKKNSKPHKGTTVESSNSTSCDDMGFGGLDDFDTAATTAGDEKLMVKYRCTLMHMYGMCLMVNHM